MTASDRLAGKVAVITGGASGIGLAAVKKFLSEGARVVFCDLAPTSRVDLESRIGNVAARYHHTRRKAGGENDGEVIAERLGPNATFVAADVTDYDAMQHVIETAVDRYGALDVLFNNAGIGGSEGSISDLPPEGFDRLVAVNMKAVWLGMKAAVPHLKAAGGGSIISTSSAAAQVGFASLCAYSATKAGVLGLTRSAAVELAPYLIRVNALCPGRIRTPIGYDSPLRESRIDPESLSDEFRNGQPLPVIGEAEHIADAALWLASDEARFVTGQTISVDGGLTIQSGGISQRTAEAPLK